MGTNQNIQDGFPENMKEVRFYLGTNSLNVCRRDPPSLSRQLWEFLNDDPLCQKFWVMSKAERGAVSWK